MDPKTNICQFYMLPHTRQSGRTMSSVSVGHIYTETDPTRGERVATAWIEPGTSPPPPPFAVSTAVKIKSVSPFFFLFWCTPSFILCLQLLCVQSLSILHDYVMEKDKNGKKQISLRFQPFEHAFFKAERVCIKTKATIIKVCIDDIEGGRVHTACKYM